MSMRSAGMRGLELFEELVTVAGAVTQHGEDCRLGEALEPRPNLPAPGAETTAPAGSARELHATSHAEVEASYSVKHT